MPRDVIAPGWETLAPFGETIEADEQVLLVAGTNGGKSTLWATLTLPVRSLIVLDDKGTCTLPAARIVALPHFDPDRPELYDDALRRALRFDPQDRSRSAHRLILRVHDLDIESFEAHDRIFAAIYQRNIPAIVVIDEVTATGATPSRCQPWLRAMSARGRTRGIVPWTCTQGAFGMVPGVLKRNAEWWIFGPIEPDDAADIHREGIEIAAALPTGQGQFVVYRKGTRGLPERLHLPIPPVLAHWRAP